MKLTLTLAEKRGNMLLENQMLVEVLSSGCGMARNHCKSATYLSSEEKETSQIAVNCVDVPGL